ncbi:RNA 2',3'-cyclic phosphodiesterase [Pontiella desulfatans]|uniref:RNA 2',3'-cyclic phosphodiesterase n=1 Tax=Pontiella desulfatans TaxID=2750659 RepID=A0A6C2TW21_PONDE|nr:RNA 2',3'-cyclic phosphodiesterase [Pontiella desulfatans]VGO11526.1 RNA 2',3'-cyclic phosphodiesterase [Pontiella desulfatans]
METIRAFIAVDIGNEIRGRLDELQRKLKKTHADVRWVKPNNIHLTLAFLGDLPVEKIQPLCKALDSHVQGTGALGLHAVGTGYFGKPNHPRVVWAGIAVCPPLLELHRNTLETLRMAGIGFDNKPFSPHLTLGRVKGPEHTGSLLQMVEKYSDIELGKTSIESAELIQSRLTPHGAEYSVLHRTGISF